MGPLASDPALHADETTESSHTSQQTRDGDLSLDTRAQGIDLAASASAPLVGAPAVIVPTSGGEPVAGEVTLWSAGDLIVTSRIRVGAESARDLAGDHVNL